MHTLYQLLHQLSCEMQRKLIADSVDMTIRALFPDKYASLCYMYAILGSNILSIIYCKQFVPVAGVALIDSGKGRLVKMLDNEAFTRGDGGAFHCWIESEDRDPQQLIDLTFRHNKKFAKANGMKWSKKKSRKYLWGPKQELCHTLPNDTVPKALPDGKVWYNKTEAGDDWLRRQLGNHNQQYAKLTSAVLQQLQLEVEKLLGNKHTQQT